MRASLAFFALTCALSAQQTFDNSGNGMLSGKYNFRQVVLQRFTADPSGSTLNRAVTLYGTIQFSGTGTYALTASVFDSNTGALQNYSFNGTYTISASGYGYLQSPVSGTEFGLVSKGIFIGSSTEDATSDLFIAAPASNSTNANFSGPYWISDLNFPTGFVPDAGNASARIVPSGGSLPTTAVTGYVGASSLINQSLSGATYSFTNGVGTLNYGGTLSAQSLLTGTRTFYLASNDAFVFGGSPRGFDFFVGVRALSGSAPANLVSGLYYHGGTGLTVGSFSTILSYTGSAKYDGASIYGHRRRLNWFLNFGQDYSYTDMVSPESDGSFTDFFDLKHFPSADGSMIIGTGRAPYLGLEIAIRAPEFSGSGVYLNPTGVLNAASSAPFTMGISPGELLTLYGTGLAPSFVANTDFPKQLNGVTVLINGRQSPIYYVSAIQIAVLVPYATGTENFANIQVVNNGAASNTVSMFVKQNTTGLFTSNQRGSGTAAALHPDFSVVTQSNPVKPGEVIAFYASGLGAVTPGINDGDLGPTNPLSRTNGQFSALVDGLDAVIEFVGLAPQLRGLYQINIRIPSGVSAGDVFVDIAGPGSYSTQATIPVTLAGTASSLPGARTAEPARHRRAEGVFIPPTAVQQPE